MLLTMVAIYPRIALINPPKSKGTKLPKLLSSKNNLLIFQFQPPYTYDVSMFPTAAAGPTSTRDGMQTYQQGKNNHTKRPI